MKHAIVVLDETGSMSGQEDRVVTSMNEYVAKLPKKAMLTVFKFDSERWTTFFSGKVKEWKKMVMSDYSPGAMTPLYDAIGKAITHGKFTSKKGDKVMLMVDTDGYENASTEYTHEKITTMIEKAKDRGWEVLFMANGLTEQAAARVATVGHKLGVTKTFAASHVLRSSSYGAAAGATQSYFDGTKATA